MDYFSNYIEVNPLKHITSKIVIIGIKDQFSKHVISKELVTNNGQAYASKGFRQFTKEWGIDHITTSPHYVQSNGSSEKII